MADDETGEREDRGGREERATDLLAFLGEAPGPQSDLPAWLLPAALRGDQADRAEGGRRAS